MISATCSPDNFWYPNPVFCSTASSNALVAGVVLPPSWVCSVAGTSVVVVMMAANLDAQQSKSMNHTISVCYTVFMHIHDWKVQGPERGGERGREKERERERSIDCICAINVKQEISA